MEATEYLTRQHREIEQALRDALAADNPDVKRSRFLDIADALILHIAAEERVFYPAVHDQPNEGVPSACLSGVILSGPLMSSVVRSDLKNRQAFSFTSTNRPLSTSNTRIASGAFSTKVR